MDRRTLLKTAFAAAALPALPMAPAVAQGKKVVKAVMNAPLRATDPVVTTAAIVQNHAFMIYDTLFAMDAQQQVRPQMAEKVETSADALTYTITLRPGLKWHDGPPVTAEDCVASINRWATRNVMGARLRRYLDAMKVVDAKSFQIVLKEPFGLTVKSLALPGTNTVFMMPKRVADTPADKQLEDQTGSGPYRFIKAEFQPGVRAVYEKFADYVPRSEPPSWMAGGKIAKIDRMEWIALGDQQSAVNALIKGEVDFIESPSWELLPQLAKASGVTVKTHIVLGLTGVLRMNWLQKPMDNPKLRQAVLHAVTQGDYMAAVVGDPNYGKECASFYPCGTNFADEVAGSPRTANLDKAKQLLQESGYKGEKIVVLQPEDIGTLAAFGPVTAQALRKIGLNIDLQSQSWAKVVERRANRRSIEEGGWHIFHTFLPNGDLLDPVTNPALSGAGERAWFGWPSDAELEKLRDDFAREGDPAKQKALAAAMQKRAFDVVPYVPLGQTLTPYAYRNTLTGILDGPQAILWNIDKA